MLKAGLVILVGSWLPLFAVGLTDPAANPIGLGLLGWAGSMVGLVMMAAGIVTAAYRLLRG
jgi:hypothetical protein